MEKTRKYGRESLVVIRDDARMIARHSLDIKSIRQHAPDWYGILWKSQADRGPYEFYRAGVEARTIILQESASRGDNRTNVAA